MPVESRDSTGKAYPILSGQREIEVDVVGVARPEHPIADRWDPSLVEESNRSGRARPNNGPER